MEAKQGFTTIDNLIREILINEGRTTLHKYLWYLSYAIKSYRQFKIDDSLEVKTTKLTLDPKKAAKYPNDLIQWNKIGIKFADRVAIILPDSTISLLHEKEGAVYKANDPWISNEILTAQFHDTQNLDNLDGLVFQGKGYNSVGYYRFNDACREIQFSAELDRCSVYVEYIAMCSSPCNKTYVPIIAMDMLQEAIKFFDFKFRYGEHDRRTIAQASAWDREQMRYKGRISDLSYEGLRNVLFRNVHNFFKI